MLKKPELQKGSSPTLSGILSLPIAGGGASLPHIQDLLGHSSFESTQIYTRVAMTDIKKIHSMTHPREKLDSRRTTRYG